MVFSSFIFLFLFLPLLLLLYFSVNRKAKNAVLLIFLVLYYVWGEPLWIIILLLDVLVGWIGGSLIEHYGNGSKAKLTLIISIA